MPSFAFWNIQKNESLLPNLVERNDLDFLAVCESTADPSEVVARLNRLGKGTYFHTPGISQDRFQVFSRFRQDLVSVRHDGARFMILRLHPPLLPPFNIMLVHAPSPASFWSDDAISEELIDLADEIRFVEKSDNLMRSIVMGDMNQNPYSRGLVSAKGFHAIMDHDESIKRKKRVVLKKSYDYFYNPMWNFFGDRTKGPPGTFFHAGSTLIEQFWQMLDQVLIRPEMLEYFDRDSLSILEVIGDESLVCKRRRPLKKKISDHLPLYFELKP